MEWLTQLDKAFGAAAAVVIGMLISALVWVVKQWRAEQLAHILTLKENGLALTAVNKESTAALLADATAKVQIVEVLRTLRKNSE